MTITESLLGSIGAAAVAGFTVWITHVFARRRERQQAKVVRLADHRRLLRERLEQLVVAASREFEEEFEGAKLPHRFHLHRKWSNAPMPLPPLRPTMLMFSQTSALQHLYLPELAAPFQAFSAELSKAGAKWDEEIIQAFRSNPEEWQIPEDFWDKLVATFSPAASAREELLVRARAMLANDFYLKSDS